MKTVPDLLAHDRLARAVADLKARSAVARTETVTGRYSDLTKALKGDVGGAHLLYKAVEDARAFQSTLSLAETRVRQTQSALAGAAGDSRRIVTDALSFINRGDDAALRTSAEDARITLTTLFASLSSSVAGRALFSGDAVDQPPLAPVDDLLADIGAILASAPDAAAAELALDEYFNDPLGGFATTIYTGGAGEAPRVEIAPGVRIGASVKADAQPLKDMMRGLAVLANYGAMPTVEGPERDAVMRSAVMLSIDAESRIVEMRAAVGIAESRISASRERHQNEETVLTSLINSKTARDPYEAASALQHLESQLEASYLMTARLSRLSLANFIR